MSSISVVIPTRGRHHFLKQALESVLAQTHAPKEIIVVDDGSKDGTRDILKKLAEKHKNIQLIFQEVNQGKGAALRTGFQHATGDVVIIQDADLEYDPDEYPKLLAPIIAGRADVVFGSRFLGSGSHRVLYFWHAVGNRFLTLMSNMFTNLNLTDMETCYKVFRREIIQAIPIEENRFGFEPEITAKLARRLTQRDKKKVLMASLDVRRPAAMEQLAAARLTGAEHAFGGGVALQNGAAAVDHHQAVGHFLRRGEDGLAVAAILQRLVEVRCHVNLAP